MSEVTAVPLRPVGKKGLAALWAGIACFVVAGVGAAWATAEKPALSAMAPQDFLAANTKRNGVHTTGSGLQYKVLKAGSGPHVTINDIVSVEYRGTLVDGTQFDASQPGQPVQFPVAGVVPGFTEALLLMSKGATYRVWLPPQLAYGDRQAGPIPPNSVLAFDITLDDFAPMPPQPAMPQMGLGQQPQGDPTQGDPTQPQM
ncbi:FKBP-type peptidyl-prolyl cis-trans isomerase [uncultured Sphingomonas sp.]|uniref:FKBP-type peptidyl-prolyl cis-trans isomerase n=1 Tax=uncultured Sphingomonas sp. TaxID=158754 RepID=UPI0025E6E633|nr:FKBP-type peptidyl-prolyl cis-trans isomerase [uncultured Sphingomonas sp.]